MTLPMKLRPKEAADRSGISVSTLAKMRMRGDGPPYSKLGDRIVVYDLGDLEHWVAVRKRRSTSEQGQGLVFKNDS
jgi:predicted DNA-binding transcriptional regulator AlpA